MKPSGYALMEQIVRDGGKVRETYVFSIQGMTVISCGRKKTEIVTGVGGEIPLIPRQL